jgi:hypothetical protein
MPAVGASGAERNALEGEKDLEAFPFSGYRGMMQRKTERLPGGNVEKKVAGL